jgi:peroxiredoxin
MKSNYLLLLIFTVFFLQTGFGQDVNYLKLGIESKTSKIPVGLKEGDKAPDFTGYDQTGKQVTLKKFLEKGPVVLLFYRGKWCPVCNRYLSKYQDSVKLITDQGVTFVAITPESIENVEQTVQNHKITFTVIYDCQEKIMSDYDVMFSVTKAYQDKIISSTGIDIAKNNGHDPAHLPVPATFIIDKNGNIVATQFDLNYQNRASVKWMIKNLGRAF